MPAGTLILAASLSLVTLDDPVTDTVDIIELNHCHAEYGEHVADYWLFWRWDGWGFRIGDWRSVCKQDVLRGNVLHKWDRVGYRRVVGRQYRETWTLYDPEVRDRYVLPKELRRKLTPLDIPSSIRYDLSQEPNR